MTLEVDPKFLMEEVFQPQAWDKFGISVKEPVSETKEVEDYDDDEGYEQIEEHVCPLCESYLEEELPQEVIDEHFSMVLDIIDEVLTEDTEIDEAQEEDPDEEDENFIQGQ